MQYCLDIYRAPMFLMAFCALATGTSCTSDNCITSDAERVLYIQSPTKTVEHRFRVTFQLKGDGRRPSSFEWVIKQHAAAGIPSENYGWYVKEAMLEGSMELVSLSITYPDTDLNGTILIWEFVCEHNDQRDKIYYENYVTRNGNNGVEMIVSHSVSSSTIHFENEDTIILSPTIDLSKIPVDSYSYLFMEAGG
ncbi:MAG: hypothetical protein KTR15_12895 [Phycisphaeraceae bacterium]|nr:hypothetical protein [Phycisphaeraceae bacterium]